MDANPERTDRTEEFLTLLNAHEAVLSAFVHSLVRPAADALDVLQETRLVLWRGFDQFEPGTNFAAWAKKVAFYQILTYRRKAKRPETELSEAFLESVAAELTENGKRYDRRAEALKYCVKKLSRPHRRVLFMRYSRDMGIEEIAEAVERTEGAVYRLLSRIRLSLQDCVTRRMANPIQGGAA